MKALSIGTGSHQDTEFAGSPHPIGIQYSLDTKAIGPQAVLAIKENFILEPLRKKKKTHKTTFQYHTNN